MRPWYPLMAAILLAVVGAAPAGAGEATAAGSLPLYRVDVAVADAVGRPSTKRATSLAGRPSTGARARSRTVAAR